MQLALHNLNDYYHIIAIDTKNPSASDKSMYLTKPPDYFTSSYKSTSGMINVISTFSNMTVTYLRRETLLTYSQNTITENYITVPDIPLVKPIITRITPFYVKPNKQSGERDNELTKIRKSVLSGKTLGELFWNY